MNDIMQKDLMEALGLEDLPREKQIEVIEKTGALLFKLILQESIQRLPEEHLDELETLMSDPQNTDKVYLFLKEKIENFDSLVEEVITNFKKESFEVLDSIK